MYPLILKISRLQCLVFLLFLGMNSFAFSSSGAASAEEVNRPKLTILIGVDQFPAIYLEQYNSIFTGGFRRIIDEGLWYKAGIVDHAPTVSLAGHTTLATGSNPRRHGITANEWIAPGAADENGRYRATVPHVDYDSHVVGIENSIGFSRHNILVPTIADWFRTNDPNARTVSLSVTPLAVLYGNKPSSDRSDNHIYWLGGNGKFVTSTYYRDDYPGWLDKFNQKIAGKYLGGLTWKNTVPTEFQGLARQDVVPYEHDGVHTSFPHLAAEQSNLKGPALKNWWFGRYSPLQNDALFDMAKESISQLKLGQRSSADFLSLAVKLTDRIGHDFGPQSLEQMDVIFRLDILLGDFMRYLDETVGKTNYVIAISADHGAPNVSEYEQAEGRDALRISSGDIEQSLKGVETLIENHKGADNLLPGLIAARLEQEPFISRAMTAAELQNQTSDDPIIQAFSNSYIPDRVWTYPLWARTNVYGQRVTRFHPALHGVVVDVAYQANLWTASSTHGSAYQYDREVPILFFGQGVAPRLTDETAYTRDIAPTLAALSGVRVLGEIDGKILGTQ